MFTYAFDMQEQMSDVLQQLESYERENATLKSVVETLEGQMKRLRQEMHAHSRVCTSTPALNYTL